MRRTLVAVPVLIGALALGGSATATAETPGCTAGALSSALGTVADGTGAWLNAHPEADAMLTGVADTGNRDAVRVYFAAHQSEWAELQAIAQPLRTLRANCGGDGASKATGIGDLYNAMSS